MACALCASVLFALPCLAHPLGDFSINQYFIVDGDAPRPAFHYLLDVAEIPSFTELDLLDSDFDSEVSQEEVAAYLKQRIPQLAQYLHLRVNGREVPLSVLRHKLILLEGNGGMVVFNIQVSLEAKEAEWPEGGPVTLAIESENYPEEQGTRECLVLPGARFTDTTGELPAEVLGDQALVEQQAVAAPVYLNRKATFTLQLSPGASAAPSLSLADVADFGWTSTVRLAKAAGEESMVAGTRKPLVDSGDREGASGEKRPLVTVASGTGETTTSPEVRETPDVVEKEADDKRNVITVTGATDDSVATGKRAAADTFTNRLMTQVSDIVRDKELPPLLFGLGLLVATLLGMGHALSPGHGKTVMAAYLIGEQGTSWHALILGIVVTLTHTWSVIALGLVTLYFKEFLSENQVNFWTGILSGAIIVIIGVYLFRQRYHRLLATAGGAAGDWRFFHGHDHVPAETPPVEVDAAKPPSYKSIFWLGISGGVVPCPSALIVLLLALKVGRLAYGLALLVAFSIGLAIVLVLIGILVVRASRMLKRQNLAEHPAIRLLPLASAGLITLLGGWVVVWTLLQFQVLQFG